MPRTPFCETGLVLADAAAALAVEDIGAFDRRGHGQVRASVDVFFARYQHHGRLAREIEGDKGLPTCGLDESHFAAQRAAAGLEMLRPDADGHFLAIADGLRSIEVEAEAAGCAGNISVDGGVKEIHRWRADKTGDEEI